jgi:hypothetical protein
MDVENARYSLIEVNDKKTAREFLIFPVRLYKNDKNYIRPLDNDVNKIFDTSFNKQFRHGALIRWILMDAKKNTIGRIAAFYESKTSKNYEQPTGAIGFFECINDQKAADVLFNASRKWLEDKGLEAMDGPVNFGDRDRWWGLLVDGFYPPNYCQNYNFDYYQSLFENYGFRNYFEQYTYYRLINRDGLDPRIEEKAERIAKNPSYTFRHLIKKELPKFSDDFRIIYNKGWTRHLGVKEISTSYAELMLGSMKKILDEKLMWFAYYNDEPVAFFLMLPEINQIIRHMNGKMGLQEKIKFMWYKWTRHVTKAYGVIFGVVPEHQGKGVEGAIVMAFGGVALKPGFSYKELELNWIGDFNPVMMRLAEQVGGKVKKTHITYRLLFDPSKEFTRAKKLGVVKNG